MAKLQGQALSRNLQYYSNCAERASLHKYRCRIFLGFQRWAIWRIGRTGHFQPKQLILQVPRKRLPPNLLSVLREGQAGKLRPMKLLRVVDQDGNTFDYASALVPRIGELIVLEWGAVGEPVMPHYYRVTDVMYRLDQPPENQAAILIEEEAETVLWPG